MFDSGLRSAELAVVVAALGLSSAGPSSARCFGEPSDVLGNQPTTALGIVPLLAVLTD